MNDQEEFWINRYGELYRHNNSVFNQELGVEAWRKMTASAVKVNSILECGPNIGRNIGFLNIVLPEASKSIVEINQEAYNIACSSYDLESSCNSSILDAEFNDNVFDLVFTTGVLIHISPDKLLDNMSKLFNLSSRYILIGEYFNRELVSIPYHGESDKLFKMDFGRCFVENFPVSLVDYGFLWGWIYDPAGFDDVTWWLFEKNEA